MNFEPCSAAKDCLRTYYLVLDDMKYAISRARLTNSISENFTFHFTPLQRAASILSENILSYSSFKPIRDIAELICAEKKRCVENMRVAKRSCAARDSTPRELEEYMKRFSIISERLMEETYGAEISERINCDYVRQMIPLLEGEIRIAENALCFNICPSLVNFAREVVESNKTILYSLRKLICILD